MTFKFFSLHTLKKSGGIHTINDFLRYFRAGSLQAGVPGPAIVVFPQIPRFDSASFMDLSFCVAFHDPNVQNAKKCAKSVRMKYN